MTTTPGGTPPSPSGDTIAERLAALGLTLPQATQTPPGVTLPFPWVRIVGDRAYVSGHGPLNADGSLAHPLGKVGLDVSADEAYAAARLTGLAILGSLQRALGSLERIDCWVKALGMVNVASDFTTMPNVINGFSDLIIALWGPERGAHARSAVGMAALPFGIPVEIEAEVLLLPA